MTKLEWNATGERFFETGVDRGVLYTSDGLGVAWNGLVSVKERPSGGKISSYYLDGIKIHNIASRKEFNGSIEAYTYPDEFLEYDGYTSLANGLMVDEQTRKSFAFSYRTRIGNDISSHDYGYKIHIVYGAIAEPTESSYDSIGDNVDPITFAWNFTTLPVTEGLVAGVQPTSHVIIDSTKTNPAQLAYLESVLYGTDSEEPILPSLETLFAWFADPILLMHINADRITGIYKLEPTMDVALGDVVGRPTDGVYQRSVPSSLVPSVENPDLYTFGVINALAV